MEIYQPFTIAMEVIALLVLMRASDYFRTVYIDTVGAEAIGDADLIRSKATMLTNLTRRFPGLRVEATMQRLYHHHHGRALEIR
jgi:hypothetical protein